MLFSVGLHDMRRDSASCRVRALHPCRTCVMEMSSNSNLFIFLHKACASVGVTTFECKEVVLRVVI